MALAQPDENLQPDEISPDTGPTENMSSGELVTNTTVVCITRISTPDAAECLEYSDEGTAATTPPAGPVVTETTVPGDGSSTVEEGTSPVFDPFGVDLSGTPSPFQGASTSPDSFERPTHGVNL